MAKNEVVKTKKNEVADATNTGQRRGFENMDKTGVKFPEIKLMQSGSPEVKLEEFREFNIRPGDIFNGVSLEKLSGEFIPIMIWDDKILFKPMEDAKVPELAKFIKDNTGTEMSLDGDIICRAPDNITGETYGKCKECPMSKWINGEPPKCRFNVNVLAITPESGMPAVIRFSSTSYKTGITLKSMTLFGGGDVFSKKYKVGSKPMSKGKMDWFEYTVIPKGKVTEDEYEMGEAFYNEFKDMVIQVHGEGEDAPATSDEY